jgi:CRP-like cAMP-binding protein
MTDAPHKVGAYVSENVSAHARERDIEQLLAEIDALNAENAELRNFRRLAESKASQEVENNFNTQNILAQLQEIALRKVSLGNLTISELTILSSICALESFPADTILRDLQGTRKLAQEKSRDRVHQRYEELVEPDLLSDKLFFIREGTVQVSWKNYKISMGPGDMIGTFSYYAPDIAPDSVVVVKPVHCISLPIPKVEELLTKQPIVGIKIFKAIAREGLTQMEVKVGTPPPRLDKRLQRDLEDSYGDGRQILAVNARVLMRKSDRGPPTAAMERSSELLNVMTLPLPEAESTINSQLVTYDDLKGEEKKNYLIQQLYLQWRWAVGDLDKTYLQLELSKSSLNQITSESAKIQERLKLEISDRKKQLKIEIEKKEAYRKILKHCSLKNFCLKWRNKRLALNLFHRVLGLKRLLYIQLANIQIKILADKKRRLVAIDTAVRECEKELNGITGFKALEHVFFHVEELVDPTHTLLAHLKGLDENCQMFFNENLELKKSHEAIAGTAAMAATQFSDLKDANERLEKRNRELDFMNARLTAAVRRHQALRVVEKDSSGIAGASTDPLPAAATKTQSFSTTNTTREINAPLPTSSTTSAGNKRTDETQPAGALSTAFLTSGGEGSAEEGGMASGPEGAGEPGSENECETGGRARKSQTIRHRSEHAEIQSNSVEIDVQKEER